MNQSNDQHKAYLFTDGSVNNQLKIGFGSYFVLNKLEFSENILPKIVRFNNTSSTKLELQTLLHAIDELPNKNIEITVFTDSQNIIGLPERIKTLAQNNYISKGGKELKNSDLYKEFAAMVNTLNIHILKVKGHDKRVNKTEIDHLFNVVDKASRKALRNHLNAQGK